MLTPDYFYGKSDKLIEMYQELEDWILQDIAMRLMKSGELSGTADRELWKLQQMGLHYEEIVKKIAQLTKKSKGEVRKLLNDSVMTSYSNDVDVLNMYGSTEPPNIHEAARMAANAEFVKTCGDLSNLTRTTMVQSQRDLLNMLNEVDYRVTSGMQSYSSAVCEVLDRYAQRGVVIDYPTGAKRSLDAAVRCCIVTSMNQTAAQVTNQYIVEGGIEYVLVSAHMGARHNDNYPYGVESHDYWQGRVYKVVGSEDGIPNLTEATGYSIDLATRQGNVVNPLGLHGYNCRHSHRPWDKSLRNPYVDADGNPKIDVHESMEQYENQQKQRVMERNIRQTKRQLLMKKEEIDGIAETDVKELLQPEYDKLAYKLRRQNKAYNAFCEQNNLQKQSDRLKVAGFKKPQAAKANGRATAYQNSVIKYKGIPDEWMKTKGKKISPALGVINPNQSMQNCASGVVAYEMRQRGFDVIAKDKGIQELMEKPWKAWDNVEPVAEYAKDDIIELVKSEKGNCRYELAFDHKYGSHCVVLEKYEDNLTIVDPQLGIRYNVEEYNTEMNNILFWKINDANISKEGVKGCKVMN